VREEHLAADAPNAIPFDQHKEITVSRAAPISRLEPRHRGVAGILYPDELRFETGEVRRICSIFRGRRILNVFALIR
jgi:hypothetical protein